jgi:hypothetical protein
MSKNSSFRRLVAGATAVVLLGLAAPALAADFTLSGKPLKTTGLSSTKVLPFFQEVAAYQDAVVANQGKPPADAVIRIKRMRAAMGPLITETDALVARAKANGETDRLNAAFLADMALEKQSVYGNEIKALGGATTVLTAARSAVPADIDSLARDVARNSFGDVFAQLFGVTSAEAGMRYRGCMLVMWAAPGPTPDTAYRLCDRYS